MRVLVTGIAGKIGRLVGARLIEEGHEVAGVDRRPWPDAPDGVTMHHVDIRKRGAEEVFRSFQPEGVIHMGTVTHLAQRSEDRFRINLQGTRAVFNHSERYGAKQVIFVGRHTYYGAAADSPLYHTEDEPPMAIHSFPELADLVAADLYAGSALWRMPEIDTAVLRLCYTLGPARHGTLAAYLRGPRVPTVLGFDPLFQFLHERDAARAIVLSLTSRLRGVYNVAGPAPVPLSVIIKETGRRVVAVPEPLLNLTLGRFGLLRLPKGAIAHLKYPIVIDNAPFREATGFTPGFDEDEAMRAFAEA